MVQRKISFVQLEKLAQEGLGVTEIARELGVVKSTVSKALKKLNVAVTKDTALRSAVAIADQKIDAMEQLKRINDLVNTELDAISESIKTATGTKKMEW